MAPNLACRLCELDALRQLNSNRVICLYDYFIDEHAIYLILEYCPRGSLMDHIRRCGPLHGEILRCVCKQLLLAVSFIHSRRVAHLDIKPSNILIDRYSRPRLADFGLARMFVNDDGIKQRAGTLLYMSPELLLGRSNSSKKIDPFKADVWALGVTFYVLATGDSPFGVFMDGADLKEKIVSRRYTISSDVDPEIANVINMMFRESDHRPSYDNLLSLPVFMNTNERGAVIPCENRVKGDASNFNSASNFNDTSNFTDKDDMNYLMSKDDNFVRNNLELHRRSSENRHHLSVMTRTSKLLFKGSPTAPKMGRRNVGLNMNASIPKQQGCACQGCCCNDGCSKICE
ncbi:CAMK family protein kinase [Tritrichomonas foetus]|uniref:CAMK family protein kinase n=1 Tax=Tritrichomonas foetus TaxID=1144522 RepID=A0A1J4JKY8_9EUKA|nr:CAMK family protein kinase [Tritrichomonas foetus]|eukprot:OHS99754.1 CAMK family protein kinase [Tritrichomonas foetus]